MRPKKTMKLSKIVMGELGKRSKECQKFVRKSLLSERIEHQELRQALEHYFSYWNDFTHPGIFSVACEAVGGDPADIVEAQAAMTMMAAAFDLHDDIVDGSKTKHGYPTVFGSYGKEITLLLGNAFMIDGFTLMGKAASTMPPERSGEVFSVLKASFFNVGNAHASELRLKRRIDASPEEYLKILEEKAASIEADVHIGALFGGGSRREVQALARYGRVLGTLAALREEFIDVFEIEELNQRIRAEALPVPVLFALQDRDSAKRARGILAKNELSSEDVENLLDVVLASESVETLRTRMSNLVARANRMTSYTRNVVVKKLFGMLAASTLEDL